MKIVNGLVFVDGKKFEKGNVEIAGKRIAGFKKSQETEPPLCNCANCDIIDATGCYVVPGFMDVHFHGCVGHDFSDGNLEGLIEIAAYELKHGVTSICPATMTLPYEKLVEIVSCGKLFCNREITEKTANLLGIHLEGPFLSKQRTGAQNSKYMVPPDIAMYQRLQDASGGLLKLITLAPETEGAPEFVDALHKEVSISLGHTTADYHTALKAFRAGANHVTHLFNAMPPFHHRESGLIGAALDMIQEKPIYTELICDGLHVSPPVIRSAFAMFSDDNILLISDSMRATGMPEGVYTLGQQEVYVTNRSATLKDGTLAGSVTNLYECFRHAIAMGIPFESALKAVTINPAKSIGMHREYGSISIGKLADLLILNPDLTIREIILHGDRIVLAATPDYPSATSENPYVATATPSISFFAE